MRNLAVCALALSVALSLAFADLSATPARNPATSAPSRRRMGEPSEKLPAQGQKKRPEPVSQLSYLTFDELVQLSGDDVPAELQAKLDTLLQTPVLSNSIAAGEAHLRKPANKKTGPALRMAQWNIERGLELDLIKLALTDPEKFEEMLDKGRKDLKPEEKEKVLRQARVLRGADVLLLNEVDLGMKRTDYADVARELATTLGMNFTYGVEFVEVDAVESLGTESSQLEDEEMAKRMDEELKPDPAKFRGLHGNAILSRYPIENPRIYKLPVCHDWYVDEKKEISDLEKGKRKASNALFLERIDREVRRGNRMALAAEIRVPESPTGAITVVDTHLENKCVPKCRREQMQTIFEAIKDDKNPVVIAGDMNTMGKDGSPMSVRKTLMKVVKDYNFWAKAAINWFTPVSLPTYALMPFKYWRTYRDPTVANIPLVGKNGEAGLFADVKKFKFADGGSFDTRGMASRSLTNKEGTFGNSNERATKGFEPTFSMPRDFGGVAKLKLDWFFVKPVERHVGKKRAPEDWFEPYYPMTMGALNDSVEGRLSDHCPIVVDLPLKPPVRPRVAPVKPGGKPGQKQQAKTDKPKS
jgi:endonuclease/exonuclease/phosphatase family metal-dependent hydrolase